MTSMPPIDHAAVGARAFAKARLANVPTALERMARLEASERLNKIWVKRDDLTGLAMGGNKARQLEFYLGQAVERDADAIIITGAVQSNYVRMAAAAARKYGMRPILQLEDRVAGMNGDYRESGNVLLDKLFGAELRTFPAGGDEDAADENLEKIAAEVRAGGGNPYVIHLGANHSPLGALGYSVMAFELLDQVAGMNLKVKALVLASGSGQTHAGVLTGLRLKGCDWPVIGACVRRGAGLQKRRVETVCGNLCDLVGRPGLLRDSDIRVTDAFLGPGYGKGAPETWDAMRKAARLEGLVLDPVYTSKSMAAAMAVARPGHPLNIEGDGAVIYLHTGGQPALFGYKDDVAQAMTN